MKRTTSDHVATPRSNNIPAHQQNQDEEVHNQNQMNDHHPIMKEKSRGIKSLTPEQMDARLFLNLASKSEIKTNQMYVKIGAPNYAFSELPFDVLSKIAHLIPSPKDKSNFALINRINYLIIDRYQPLRRFPGLAIDLKRTCQAQKMARLDLMQRFDDHIKVNGGYDTALLTPLSPLSRLSIAIAMMQWAQNHTLKADKPACIKLAQERLLTEFSSLKNNTDIKIDELRQILITAIRCVLTAPAGPVNRKRSLVFDMTIANQIMKLLKGDVIDATTERKIFFEVLKADPNDQKNIKYLENNFTHWSFEDLAVLMMLQPSYLLFHRLRELSPEDRSSAIIKMNQALQGNPHIESLSRYAGNIVCVCAISLAALGHQFTDETPSIINSFIELFRSIENTPPANNQKPSPMSLQLRINIDLDFFEKDHFVRGLHYANPLNIQHAELLLSNKSNMYQLSNNVFKGYVYQRILDWIKALPAGMNDAQMTSALNSLFNINNLIIHN